MIKDLVKLSRELDKQGLIAEADDTNAIIRRIAESPDPGATAVEEAKKQFSEGAAAYQKKDYEAAKLHFIKGYRLSNKPSFLFNIGMCAYRMGDLNTANSYMRQFLAGNPDPSRKAKAEEIVNMVASEEPEEAIAVKLTDKVVNTVRQTGREVNEKQVGDFIGGLFT